MSDKETSFSKGDLVQLNWNGGVGVCPLGLIISVHSESFVTGLRNVYEVRWLDAEGGVWEYFANEIRHFQFKDR